MKKPETPALEIRTVSDGKKDHEQRRWHFLSRGIIDAMPSYEGEELPIGKPKFDDGTYLPSYDNFYMTFEADYVLGKCDEILREVPVPTSEDGLRSLLKEQFSDKILDEHWEAIESDIREFEEEGPAEDDFDYDERKFGHHTSLLLAIWADLTCEPLSTPWLAAMALHAFYVADMPFTAGYMCALIDMQEKHEADALRGKATVANGRKGGEMNASSYQPERREVVAAMRPLIENGLSAKAAGRVVFSKHGLGTSGAANAKRWSRYLKSLKK